MYETFTEPMPLDLDEFVAWCYRCYSANGLEVGNPDDGEWVYAHHPLPSFLKGFNVVGLTKRHHAIHGVLQSMALGTPCVHCWEIKELVRLPLEFMWLWSEYDYWYLQGKKKAGKKRSGMKQTTKGKFTGSNGCRVTLTNQKDGTVIECVSKRAAVAKLTEMLVEVKDKKHTPAIVVGKVWGDWEVTAVKKRAQVNYGPQKVRVWNTKTGFDETFESIVAASRKVGLSPREIRAVENTPGFHQRENGWKVEILSKDYVRKEPIEQKMILGGITTGGMFKPVTLLNVEDGSKVRCQSRKEAGEILQERNVNFEELLASGETVMGYRVISIDS